MNTEYDKPLSIAVEGLMTMYFKNKDAQKDLQAERSEFSSKNWCLNYGGNSKWGEESNCFKERAGWLDEDQSQELCENCKKRNAYYLANKKLSYENRGIMTRVKNLVKNKS